jgi:hypothetical protein
MMKSWMRMVGIYVAIENGKEKFVPVIGQPIRFVSDFWNCTRKRKQIIDTGPQRGAGNWV